MHRTLPHHRLLVGAAGVLGHLGGAGGREGGVWDAGLQQQLPRLHAEAHPDLRGRMGKEGGGAPALKTMERNAPSSHVYMCETSENHECSKRCCTGSHLEIANGITSL